MRLWKLTGVPAGVLCAAIGLSASWRQELFAADSKSQSSNPATATAIWPKTRRLSKAAENGRAGFYRYACWRCHTLGDEELPGNPDLLNSGPDLLTVGDRLSKEALYQSVVAPNAAIAEPVKDHTQAGGSSKMPSFAEAMSAAEINDLVAFLSDLKSAATEKTLIFAVTARNFELEVKRAETLVLLDFWAEWCLPCLELEPIIKKLSVELQNRVKICKINIEENPALVAEYVPDNIFPCLILMKHGRLIDRRYGTDPKMKPDAFLRQWITQHLPAKGE